ncbi:MAG: hypothetical protein ISP90_05860 [Nevskia sp.]|nr:hypothetical protein [Nevskia sp.]
MFCTGRARGFALAACCGLTAALSSAPAGAAGYSYLEGGFIYRDDYGRDGGGGRVAASLGLIPNLALIGEYDGTEHLDQFDVGAIFHVPVARGVDFFAGGTLEHANLEHDRNDTGFGGRAGLRWHLGNALEVDPELRVVRVFDDTQTSARLTALYRFAPHFDFQGAVQGGDDTRVEFGLRYDFATR